MKRLTTIATIVSLTLLFIILVVCSNHIAICIGEIACQNHDEVDQCPNATTSSSKQLSNTCDCLAYIKTMNTIMLTVLVA